MKAPKVGLDALSEADREQLKADIERWLVDPIAFVMEVFAPGWEAEHEGLEFKLEKWHIKGLRALLSPKRRVAAKASKGVGKTAFLAWVGWWFLLTRQHVKAAATSITGDNLDDGLWTEFAVWQNYSPLLQLLFQHKATEIHARSEKDRDTWWLSRRTFATAANKEQQSATLAGLHADAILVLLDEVGAYPMGVFRAAEGIFTDKNADALLVICGNCNDQDGPLGVVSEAECEYWELIEINGDPDDPDRCTRVDIEEARAEILKHGRNDPGVRINILGLFPLRASSKLLGGDEVAAAMKRDSPKRNWITAPKIFGLDTAEEGDDSNRLCLRQGAMSWQRPEWQWRQLEPEDLADRVGSILMLPEYKDYDALFIDITGGWGEASRLRLRDLRFRNVIGVDFGSTETLDPSFQNKRAEMYYLLADWIRTVGCLPKSDRLKAELCAPGKKIGQKGGRSTRMLEPKKDIKARLKRSPDDSDSFALTFAAPVFKRADDDVVFQQTSTATPDGKPFNPWTHMRGGQR